VAQGSSRPEQPVPVFRQAEPESTLRDLQVLPELRAQPGQRLDVGRSAVLVERSAAGWCAAHVPLGFPPEVLSVQLLRPEPRQE
jgi:hypothetical protein